ncbi:hypothetical protein A2641_01830 [Candidatus Nomurabacteria bacterium RIFCSPHIGHO2_01_FULL_37_25]|nr:MAG: hypothetical protein A2641_01830 [Candidatus Nomurabacteria bacterium RIFCSPHIGHO2_01_FULL_37_25]OGI76040.1 MAG: hypothetical protein A3D36_00710 [Candidatus Nomurabacteria bacterium RIFCSPHIGHO2_02_FULL_36_29]
MILKKLVEGVLFRRPFAGRRAEKFAPPAGGDRLPYKKLCRERVSLVFQIKKRPASLLMLIKTGLRRQRYRPTK